MKEIFQSILPVISAFLGARFTGSPKFRTDERNHEL